MAVRRMTHQLNVLAGQKVASLSQYNRIDRPTMLKWNSRHKSPVLSKKQATICFEVIFQQTTFVAFGSGSKKHTVDC